MNIAQDRRLKNGKIVKQLLQLKENKNKALSFNVWQTQTKKAITNEKVALTIRTMAAATKIFELCIQHSQVKRIIKLWRERCHQRDSQALGLQIINSIVKRKLKYSLKMIYNQAKKRRNARKSHKVKAMLLGQLIHKILKQRYHAAFSAIQTKYLVIQTEAEKQKLKQKKKEIHNQIVLLSEKDSKIRKQEAFLGMKEQKIIEQEKEIKERQKRIAEINKFKEQQRKGGSKSPICQTARTNS